MSKITSGKKKLWFYVSLMITFFFYITGFSFTPKAFLPKGLMLVFNVGALMFVVLIAAAVIYFFVSRITKIINKKRGKYNNIGQTGDEKSKDDEITESREIKWSWLYLLVGVSLILIAVIGNSFLYMNVWWLVFGFEVSSTPVSLLLSLYLVAFLPFIICFSMIYYAIRIIRKKRFF